ncbi:MAG: flagellar hook-length control protein FliK [Aquidulcibacter sp.]|uniref:flagellar hook-length control protein FliK n=1 Tax=Aquidulcibacter sp. TaxID=2052990 RepID=UPI0022C85ABF|nr:flagellar hook-length control protein FliK [Aquidulcibacter sp.]MCZ8209759.1 flagellar hook-length control protein FliK [Aquidulcibacter sp.]
MVGRIMDSIAEAPQSRRAKPSVSPAGDMGASSGLSFVDTMIGLVQPPSPQEPAKAAPESSEVGISLKLAPEPLLKDGTSLTDTSSITSLAVPALPLASTPINLIPKTPADAAIQEGTGATGLANAAQNVAITLGLTGDTFVKELVLAPGDISGAEPVAANPDIKSGEALPVTTQTADVLATTSNDTSTPAQALALKTQAAASQSLMAGLSASGQTQQPAPKDSQVAQLAASAPVPAPAPAPAQVIQPNPQPTDAATAQAVPTLDAVLANQPQGPGAARALEAQASQANGLKSNSPAGWLANGAGMSATNDAGFQSTPSALTVATATPQANAAAATGLVPNLAKTGTKTEEAKIAATDASGMMGGSNGAADAATSVTVDGTVTPAQDTTPKPSLVQPHTIPMLAAAMMRRISNGMKEFTLRLDPPELGRVDVRLTVGPDKKVRAVVSTDRPEALKDLALSARDLTRALQEAGLDLEENGLSFSMNDQGSSQQNRDTHQQQSARMMGGAEVYETSEAAKSEASAPLSTPLSGPVERWQRARIALTA